jgi:hypothetical protein
MFVLLRWLKGLGQQMNFFKRPFTLIQYFLYIFFLLRCLVNEKKKILNFLLTSFKTPTNSEDCSEAAVEFLFRSGDAVIVQFSALCNVHVISGSRNNSHNHR